MPFLKNITKNDFFYAQLNSQVIKQGASITDKQSEKVYFITHLIGTSIIVQDKDGNTVITGASNISFHVPLRLDGGFVATGTNMSVHYFII